MHPDKAYRRIRRSAVRMRECPFCGHTPRWEARVTPGEPGEATEHVFHRIKCCPMTALGGYDVFFTQPGQKPAYRTWVGMALTNIRQWNSRMPEKTGQVQRVPYFGTVSIGGNMVHVDIPAARVHKFFEDDPLSIIETMNGSGIGKVRGLELYVRPDRLPPVMAPYARHKFEIRRERDRAIAEKNREVEPCNWRSAPIAGPRPRTADMTAQTVRRATRGPRPFPCT